MSQCLFVTAIAALFFLAAGESHAFGISDTFAQTPQLIPVSQTTSSKLPLGGNVGLCRTSSPEAADRACHNHFLNCKAVQWGASADQIIYCP